MITLDQYVGVWKNHENWNGTNQYAAALLLDRVNALLKDYIKAGRELEINPKTKSHVSGEIYGGFRPLDCPIGAKNSSHKLAMAVDVYDPFNSLDIWIDANPSVLEKHNLYREHASATRNWCHLSTKAPRSGKRTFFP